MSPFLISILLFVFSFIYAEMRTLLSGEGSDWIHLEPGCSVGFMVRSEVTFHLYCSHTPCGDASIIPVEFKGEVASHECEQQFSDRIMTGDVHRTGAKCTEFGPQDPLLPGPDYHVTGAFRIKPGRGERTLSMSCSDKVAKWTVMGIQGSLLMSFLRKPIYLTSIIIGQCPFSEASILRAVHERTCTFNSSSTTYMYHRPRIVHAAASEARFTQALQSLQEASTRPSPLGLCRTKAERTVETAN